MYAAIAADRLGLLLLGIGAAAWAGLALSLAARVAGGVPWALALLGGEYAGYLSLSRPGLAVGALYAGGFVLTAELAYRALESVGVRDDPALVLRRLVAAFTTALAAAALGALLLAFSNVDVARGFGLEALGVLAAVATLAAVAWLAHTRG